MTNETQQERSCSVCGQMLKPTLTANTVDENYNTVPIYSYGHFCPELSRKYEDRMKEIEDSPTMTPDQKRNAANAAGYMNAWSN